MLRTAELLAGPALEELDALAAGDPSRVVGSVSLVEETDGLERVEAGTFCVASRAFAATLTGYRLDTAVRLAASREASALALDSGDEGPPATAVRIAERTGVALLRIPPELDLGMLCTLISRELEGGADAALERARRFSTLLDVDSVDDPVQSVAELGARVLGVPVEVTSSSGAKDRIEAEVPSGDPAQVFLSGHAGGGATDVALGIALRLGAAEAGRALDEAARRGEAPVRSRGLLLTELLLAPAERSEPLTHRARTLGMPIDGWHVVLRLQASDRAHPGHDELADLERSDQIARVALQTVRAGGGIWHLAPTQSAPLLVFMRQHRPDHRVTAQMVASGRAILDQLAVRFPELSARIGVGGAHSGVAGLRTSAAEARAALASAADHDVVAFDPAGLRHLLVEWYASETVRESVSELLAPLEELGPRRSRVAIETLRTYLDHEGSLTRTAEVLHLHRNAVAYRIRRIFDALDLDADDPDQRLALHLACRARELG